MVLEPDLEAWLTLSLAPGLTNDAQNSRVAQTLSGFMPVVLALMPPEFDSVQSSIWWYPH